MTVSQDTEAPVIAAQSAATRKRQPKSEWVGMCCTTERDKRACCSWFPLVPASWGDPLKADVMSDIETDRERKLRALFRRDDGKLMEALRTLGGRATRTTLRPASRAILKGWRQ